MYSKEDWDAKYLVFVSSRSVKMRKFSFAQLYTFWVSVFIFQFLNDKFHNYVKQNITVNQSKAKFSLLLNSFYHLGTLAHQKIGPMPNGIFKEMRNPFMANFSKITWTV